MPDLEEVGGTGVPGLTDAVHPMEQTSAEGSGGSGSGPSMLAMASLEVNDRLRDIDELVEKGVDHVPSPLRRRGTPPRSFWVEEPDAHSGGGLGLGALERQGSLRRQGSGGTGPSSNRSARSHGSDDIVLPGNNGAARGGGGELWRPEVSSPPGFASKFARKSRDGAGSGAVSPDGKGVQDPNHVDAQMDAWLRQTVERMPVKPDHVSGVRGPLMNVTAVDDKTVDVVMTTSFRAHFSQPISTLGNPGGGNRRPELPGPGPGASTGGAVGVAARIREIEDRGEIGTVTTSASATPTTPLGEGARLSLRTGAYPGSTGRFAIASPDDYVNTDGSGNSGGSPKSYEQNQRALVAGGDVPMLNTMREWEIAPSDVQLHERVAVGGFAEVFRGTWNGTIVAVKQLLERGADVVTRLREEAVVLSRLRHPNLLLFMGWCAEPPFIATEFMRRGSLHNILRKNGGPLGGPRTHHVALSVARGMQYLHSRSPPILHLDLKSPNILVDDKWRVKIADFGLSRVRRNTLLSGRSNIHGTFEWMAPEMLRAENFDENADVYSYGVVLWELLSAPLTPWNELINVQVVAVVGYDRQRLVLGLAAQDAAREDAATRAIGELFWACAVNDPRARPTFQSVTERLEAALTLMLPGPDGGTGGGVGTTPDATAGGITAVGGAVGLGGVSPANRGGASQNAAGGDSDENIARKAKGPLGLVIEEIGAERETFAEKAKEEATEVPYVVDEDGH